MVKAEVPVYEQPPEGSWTARFTDIEEGEGEYGPYWKWFFEVDVDDDEIEFAAISSAKLGSKSKGGRWLKGLRGAPLEPGEVVDFDELINTECVISIEENEEGFARLVSVLPAKSKKAKASKSKSSRKGVSLEDPF